MQGARNSGGDSSTTGINHTDGEPICNPNSDPVDFQFPNNGSVRPTYASSSSHVVENHNWWSFGESSSRLGPSKTDNNGFEIEQSGIVRGSSSSHINLGKDVDTNGSSSSQTVEGLGLGSSCKRKSLEGAPSHGSSSLSLSTPSQSIQTEPRFGREVASSGFPSTRNNETLSRPGRRLNLPQESLPSFSFPQFIPEASPFTITGSSSNVEESEQHTAEDEFDWSLTRELEQPWVVSPPPPPPSEVVAPWSLFPTHGSSSSSSSGTTSRSLHHRSRQQRRSALLLERQNDLLHLRHLGRSLASDSEGRNRLISEIRQVLSAMRRGEDLRLEDYMVFDPLIFSEAMHDRHRDMRLDVDNMSYEELLALGERIGDVNTGLSEEVIMKGMKQHKHVSSIADMEPCCVCQEEYVEGDDLGVLGCGHEFHAVCVKQWLMVKNLCPICKTVALST